MPEVTHAYDPKLSPLEVSRSISAFGIQKANTRLWQLFLLALLAGLYISIGGQTALVALEQGMGRIAAGAVFSVGLVLVIIAGAELFTGNVTMFIGAVTGRYPFMRMMRNWLVVYLGNLVASLGCAALIFHSGLLGPAGAPNALGQVAARVCEAKLALTFGEAFIRGFFCNILVILAIILATFAKDVVSKILCCMLPVMAFIASGYEHCVANMYLIPLGLLVKGIPLAGQAWIVQNILPVTLGNIVGGVFIMVIHPNRIRQISTLWRQR